MKTKAKRRCLPRPTGDHPRFTKQCAVQRNNFELLLATSVGEFSSVVVVVTNKGIAAGVQQGFVVLLVVLDHIENELDVLRLLQLSDKCSSDEIERQNRDDDEPELFVHWRDFNVVQWEECFRLVPMLLHVA